MKSTLEKGDEKMDLAYVDYVKDSIQAHVRCKNKMQVQNIVANASNFKESLGEEIEMRILNGEEEKIYWQNVHTKSERKKMKRQDLGDSKEDKKNNTSNDNNVTNQKESIIDESTNVSKIEQKKRKANDDDDEVSMKPKKKEKKK